MQCDTISFSINGAWTLWNIMEHFEVLYSGHFVPFFLAPAVGFWSVIFRALHALLSSTYGGLLESVGLLLGGLQPPWGPFGPPAAIGPPCLGPLAPAPTPNPQTPTPNPQPQTTNHKHPTPKIFFDHQDVCKHFERAAAEEGIQFYRIG